LLLIYPAPENNAVAATQHSKINMERTFSHGFLSFTPLESIYQIPHSDVTITPKSTPEATLDFICAISP